METTHLSTPKKTREMHSNHFDSTIWNDFKFRPNDIILSTYAKSGTTWTQQILSQLLFNGAEDIEVAAISPWLDLRVPPKEVKLAEVEAQTHRRFLKTHLPVDALVFNPDVKYIYVARDGRDVLWSLYNHHAKANEAWYGALNESPGLVGPKMELPNPDVVQYYMEWLEKDGYPFWSYWENIKTWWEIKDLPNVLFLHYANLKADLPGSIRKIAAFIGQEIDESKFDDIVHHCSFEYMKAHGEKSAPLGGIFWEGGAKSFINKGTNGRWKDMLNPEQSKQFEDMAREKLGDKCAHWVMTGEM